MPHFRLSILNHKSLPKHPVSYGYFFFLRVIHDGQKFQVFKTLFLSFFRPSLQYFIPWPWYSYFSYWIRKVKRFASPNYNHCNQDFLWGAEAYLALCKISITKVFLQQLLTAVRCKLFSQKNLHHRFLIWS